MSTNTKLSAVLALSMLATVACTGPGATALPSSPGASPATQAPEASGAADPTPIGTQVTGIVHPTGPADVVLRYEDVGGFTPPEWQAARLPYFTLYGDGRVVYQQTTAEVPIREDGVMVGVPLRTGLLAEEQVQELLQFSLVNGGLAVARTDYQNPMIADVPTAVFTINAEDDSKTVSVVGLGMEAPPGPDTIVLKQLATLGERLRDFDQGGTLPSDAYTAPAYRGVILEQQGIEGVQLRDWPWDDIAPSDFALPADPNTLPQGTRTLTPEEAAAVGVKGYENGVMGGVFLRADDGKIYSLVIRPLLPGEKA